MRSKFLVLALGAAVAVATKQPDGHEVEQHAVFFDDIEHSKNVENFALPPGDGDATVPDKEDPRLTKRASAVQWKRYPGSAHARTEIQGVAKRDNVSNNDVAAINADDVIKIDVFVNVLAREDETQDKIADFILTKKDLDNQMNVLNDVYRQAKISFNLIGTKWMTNRGLFEMPKYEDGMDIFFLDTMLRKRREIWHGDHATINLFYINSTKGPTGMVAGAIYGDYRAIVVAADTVPGGARAGSNQGKTTANLIGRWLGYDAYLNSSVCLKNFEHLRKRNKTWDEIMKLPNVADKCNKEEDVCRNIMSAGHPDVCRTEFSSAQITMMRHFYQSIKHNINDGNRWWSQVAAKRMTRSLTKTLDQDQRTFWALCDPSAGGEQQNMYVAKSVMTCLEAQSECQPAKPKWGERVYFTASLACMERKLENGELS